MLRSRKKLMCEIERRALSSSSENKTEGRGRGDTLVCRKMCFPLLNRWICDIQVCDKGEGEGEKGARVDLRRESRRPQGSKKRAKGP